MKAIVTRYHGATNFKGSRVSAIAEGGNRVTLSWDDALNSDENHRKAAMALCQKKGWTFTPLISGGGLPNGDTVHMFSPEVKDAVRVMLSIRRTLGALDTRGSDELQKCAQEIDGFLAGIGHKEGGK